MSMLSVGNKPTRPIGEQLARNLRDPKRALSRTAKSWYSGPLGLAFLLWEGHDFATKKKERGQTLGGVMGGLSAGAAARKLPWYLSLPAVMGGYQAGGQAGSVFDPKKKKPDHMRVKAYGPENA